MRLGLGSTGSHQLLIVLFGDRLRFCQERRTRKRGPKCNLHILLSPEQTKHTIECFCIGSRALLPLEKKRTKNWKRLCSLVHDFQLNPRSLPPWKQAVAFLGQSNKESQTLETKGIRYLMMAKTLWFASSNQQLGKAGRKWEMKSIWNRTPAAQEKWREVVVTCGQNVKKPILRGRHTVRSRNDAFSSLWYTFQALAAAVVEWATHAWYLWYYLHIENHTTEDNTMATRKKVSVKKRPIYRLNFEFNT